jgi:hypothetical protein
MLNIEHIRANTDVTHVLLMAENSWLFKTGVEHYVGKFGFGFRDLQPRIAQRSGTWPQESVSAKAMPEMQGSDPWDREYQNSSTSWWDWAFDNRAYHKLLKNITGSSVPVWWSDKHEGQFFPMAFFDLLKDLGYDSNHNSLDSSRALCEELHLPSLFVILMSQGRLHGLLQSSAPVAETSHQARGTPIDIHIPIPVGLNVGKPLTSGLVRQVVCVDDRCNENSSLKDDLENDAIPHTAFLRIGEYTVGHGVCNIEQSTCPGSVIKSPDKCVADGEPRETCFCKWCRGFIRVASEQSRFMFKRMSLGNDALSNDVRNLLNTKSHKDVLKTCSEAALPNVC